MEGTENLPSRPEFAPKESVAESPKVESVAAEAPRATSVESQEAQNQEPTQGEQSAAEESKKDHEPEWLKKRLARQERKHREELQALQAKLSTLEKSEPKEESYEGLSDLEIVEKIAERKFREAQEKQSREFAQAEARRKETESLAQREEAFAKENPDYYDVMEDGVHMLNQLPATLVDSIKKNPNGAAIAYEIAKNPQVFESLVNSDPITQMTQLVQINLGLSQKKTQAPAEVLPPEKATKPSSVPTTPRPAQSGSTTKTFDPMKVDIRDRERSYLERKRR